MKKNINQAHTVRSVSEFHDLFSLPKPKHSLVSVVDLKDIKLNKSVSHFYLDLYTICIKTCFNGKIKYGQNYYDFTEGTMSFISPKQIIGNETDNVNKEITGKLLIFHPDFIRGYALAKNIKNFGYFSYSVKEGLYLSENEKIIIENIMADIDSEYNSSIDHYSQDVMVSYIELLLNYCNRFYGRQFITRKATCNDLLSKFEEIIDEYFNKNLTNKLGLPNVQYIADKLNISPNYLSDMLRSLTGQSTQQHIHNKLIERAKEELSTTSLSIGEIAYNLGFEYPQSFSKLFKNKTDLSPLEFRNLFN